MTSNMPEDQEQTQPEQLTSFQVWMQGLDWDYSEEPPKKTEQISMFDENK